MKYLSKEPMVFFPARMKHVEPDDLKCDHIGVKHVFVHGRWECERCGEVIE